MFHSTPSKRPRSQVSGDDDSVSPSKVYIMRIVTNKDNEIQLQFEPDDDTLCDQLIDSTNIADYGIKTEEVEEDSVPNESTHSEEQSVADQSIQLGEIEQQLAADGSDHSEEDTRIIYLSDDTTQSGELQSWLQRCISTELVVVNDDNAQLELNDNLHCESEATVDVPCVSTGESISNEPRRKKAGEKGKSFSGWIANRHKLRFQRKWLDEFPFIEYDEKSNLMFCKACRKYVNDWRKTSPFVIGTDNFRVSMLKYHKRSSMHSECQDLADALTSQDSGALEKDLYKDQLSHVFKSVYFIFKNKLPYTHYPQLCESQKREGTDFSVYTTHLKVVPLFGKFISMAFEKELGLKISDVSEFSLIIDASFRRNIESHDLVYLKYLDSFMVQTVLLGVIDSSAKLHDSMYNILTALFKKYSIEKWVEKVVYIMTDRSDSHLWHEGLMDLIKSMSPSNFFSEVLYLPHKIKFCASVVQDHKTTSTFDALLWSIYCYYERVDKGKKNLIHMNMELDEIIECYGSLPKNSYTTLYYQALKAIEEDYADLVRLLETEQLLLHFDFKIRKSGARILSVITRGSFIVKLALFTDIFFCLNDFAIKLSSEEILPYDVHMLLDEVCGEIEKATNGEGPTALKIGEELSASPSYFRGIEISENSNADHILPEVKKFSRDVISYLESLVDKTLLEKSYIFNVCMWPEDEELETYGNTEFKEIFLMFNGREKNIEPAEAEWILFKSKLLALFPFEVRQNSKSVLMKMVTEYVDQFPFVSTVLRKILLLNFESSEIKRGYHEMCLNKSFSRSMLSLQSLQTAMMISMYGPSLNECDFSLAMELFLHSRHRKFRKKIIDQKLFSNYSSDHEEDAINE